jgi:hypothetical protein
MKTSDNALSNLRFGRGSLVYYEIWGIVEMPIEVFSRFTERIKGIPERRMPPGLVRRILSQGMTLKGVGL